MAGFIAAATSVASCSSTFAIAPASCRCRSIRRTRRAESLRCRALARDRERRAHRRARSWRGRQRCGTPSSRPATSRCAAKSLRIVGPAETPVIPVARNRGEPLAAEELRLRHRHLDLRRPELQRQHHAAPPADAGDARVSQRRGLLRDRDADPHEADAGGRARLPRAEPRAPGRVLRAAAVAAALQAAAHGLRLRSLLPDRALLPRRGPARGPSAGVHADRHRGVVRHARGHHGRRRRADLRALGEPAARRCRPHSAA